MAVAQNAPGFTNPTSFYTGEDDYYWSAQVGLRIEQVPNADSAITGSCFIMNEGDSCKICDGSPYDCIFRPKIWGLTLGEDIDTLAKIYNSTYGQYYIGDTSLQMYPNRHFLIVHDNDSRTPDIDSTIGMDPYTQYKLPYCPPGYTSSIRIGNLGGDGEADGLYYNMKVRPSNSLLVINYACVIENPSGYGHGPVADPVLIIRVCKPDASDPSGYSQISDTLCYMQPATDCRHNDADSNHCITDGTAGWHTCRYPGRNGGYGGNAYYKDWTRVAVSLNNYLFQDVRVEIYSGDCAYSAHFGYSYIAGTAQPMGLSGKGCPVGESTVVDTLVAPEGLANYIFYKQISGPDQVNALAQIILDTTANLEYINTMDESTGERYRWQRISRSPISNSNNIFTLEQEDFLTAGGTYAKSKNFMCYMRSYMDPIKPIASAVYTEINYNKPVIQIDSVLSCDRTITLRNNSYSPNLLMDKPATYWYTYDNPDCVGIPLDTLYGDTVNPRFDHGGFNGLYLYAKALTDDGSLCYSEKRIPMKILEEPKAKIQITGRELCDNDQALIEDKTYPGHEDSVYRRVWGFEGVDTLVYDHYTITLDPSTGLLDSVENSGPHYDTIHRGFTEKVVPVWLDVYNGYFYVVDGDTTWCHSEARDTIRVFVKPTLEPYGDSVVCKGSKTNMGVRVVDSDTADHTYTFQWSLTNGYVSGPFPEGTMLRTEPTRDTTVYYVQVKNEKNCVAWGQARAFLVTPRLKLLDPGDSICPGWTATLVGSHADHYTWTASPTDPTLNGQETSDTIKVKPLRNTKYILVGHGSNNCDALPLDQTIYIVPVPVPKVQTEPGIIDSEDPTVTFRDVSPGHAATVWDFGDGTDPEKGEEITHTFSETYVDTVFVKMTTANVLGCPADTTFPMPVVQFTAWTPNIFSPGIETNNRFSFYTINEYEFFSIYIYDRRGRLVYKSDDVHFEWDGRDLNGRECPQGAYVWVMRYRRPGTPDIVLRKGSVTILR